MRVKVLVSPYFMGGVKFKVDKKQGKSRRLCTFETCLYGWDIGSILFYFLCTVTFNIPFLDPAT